jgi:hypothetical protein
MEAVYFSETLMSTYQFIWCHNPEKTMASSSLPRETRVLVSNKLFDYNLSHETSFMQLFAFVCETQSFIKSNDIMRAVAV